MKFELTPDKYPWITCQTHLPLCHNTPLVVLGLDLIVWNSTTAQGDYLSCESKVSAVYSLTTLSDTENC